MDFASLKGRRVVVTGASSGIGRAIALACAEGGADLVISYRQSLDAVGAVADEIRQHGNAVEFHQLSVQDSASRDAFLAACENGRPIDALVNNAGVDLLTGPARELDYLEKLQMLMSADVAGTVALSRAFGAQMLKAQRGVVLNIGWDQSDRGMEGDSGELFATAKNAVMGFTRSLALSLAPHVRVNCIAPGWIQTAWGDTASDYWQQRVMDETPLKRWGTPDDIGGMARFLISDAASFVTGQIINVNGGAVR